MNTKLGTGKAVGQFIFGVRDGTDDDDIPEVIPAQGTVTITPNIAQSAAVDLEPNPVIMWLTPTELILDPQGYACLPDPYDPSKPGKGGVRLFANDDPRIGVKNWNYTVTVNLKSADGKFIGTMDPFQIFIPTGAGDSPENPAVDMADFAPIPASVGIGSTQAVTLVAKAAASADAAQAVAADVKRRADAGEFIGAPGPNTVPTQEAVAQYLSTPGNPARTAVTRTVAEAVAADSSVADAAAKAVGSQLDSAGILRGAVVVPPTEGAEEYAGGFLGENGRPTELSVDQAGRVPKSILVDQAARAGVPSSIQGSYSTEAAGGFTGENGRETDLMLDAQGRIVEPVIRDWAGRISGYLPSQTPAEPSKPQAPSSDPRFGLNRGLTVRDRNGVMRLQTSRSDQFAAWGDSLTDGYPKPPFAADKSDAWPGVLAKLLGTEVYNGGISGQTADEIAIRSGGLVPRFLPTGGAIPASGSVVVTHPGQLIGWRTDRGFNDTGTLAGVPGKITRSGGVTSFIRTTAGEAVQVAAPQPWQSAGTMYSDATAILMLGRNDIGWASDGTQPLDRIVGANIALVESLTPMHPRFLILGTTNASGEYTGSTGWKLVTDANRILSELYPDNYLDIRSYLVSQSIYDQKLTPTADDLARMGKDAPPMQIMHDSVHYTVATAATIANRIYTELKLKGWAA